jgi:hypothetical protein
MSKKKEVDPIKEKLTLLSKRNNVPLEEIQAKYVGYMREGKTERVAYLAVVNDFRKIKQFQNMSKTRHTAETTKIRGFIVGTKGIWDKAETVRKAARRLIEKEGEEAAKEQDMIDGEGHILDTRREIYGKPNPDYGKPLPENLHVLDLMLYGYFAREGDKGLKFGTIQTSDNRLARGWDLDIVQKDRYFIPCETTAIISEESDDSITLRSTSNKDSPTVFKPSKSEIDILKIIELYTKITPINGVEKYYETGKIPAKNGQYKMAFDAYVVVKGVVTWTNFDRPDKIGRVTMGLMNSDNEEETIRVRIDPTTTPLDFGELSEVYIFAVPTRSMFTNKETGKLEDGDVILDAFGIYCVTKTPRVSNEDNGDEEVISGWMQ